MVSSVLSASVEAASAEEMEGAVVASEVVLRFEEDELEGDSSARQLWEKGRPGDRTHVSGIRGRPHRTEGSEEGDKIYRSRGEKERTGLGRDRLL